MGRLKKHYKITSGIPVLLSLEKQRCDLVWSGEGEDLSQYQVSPHNITSDQVSPRNITSGIPVMMLSTEKQRCDLVWGSGGKGHGCTRALVDTTLQDDLVSVAFNSLAALVRSRRPC
eukprot:1183998-Prorocentrum_minimum.AAC.1